MTTLYIHSKTNTSYFLAPAPLGKLTGLVLKNPVNNSSKHNLVKKVFFFISGGTLFRLLQSHLMLRGVIFLIAWVTHNALLRVSDRICDSGVRELSSMHEIDVFSPQA